MRGTLIICLMLLGATGGCTQKLLTSHYGSMISASNKQIMIAADEEGNTDTAHAHVKDEIASSLKSRGYVIGEEAPIYVQFSLTERQYKYASLLDTADKRGIKCHHQIMQLKITLTNRQTGKPIGGSASLLCRRPQDNFESDVALLIGQTVMAL